jgi:hypothetical protein
MLVANSKSTFRKELYLIELGSPVSEAYWTEKFFQVLS